MNQVAEGQSEQRASGSTVEQAGCYGYCVARCNEEVSLGDIGVQGQEVYTVVQGGLGVVVHRCSPHPYQSDAPEVAANWILAHHRVIEAAWKRWGTVLPLNFNTILKADGDSSAQESLASWLAASRDWLKSKLEHLDDKAEYGVQVFWDAAHLSQQVAQSSPEVKRLEEEIAGKPRGVAYMYRQKLEATLRREMETRAAAEYKAIYAIIGRWVADMKVERIKPGTGQLQMLMNLSCLVSAEVYPALAAELDRISATKGFSVRLVGPLPPYSFC